MLKELLLCMLWMYIRDDLFSFLPLFFFLSVLILKKWYETTESMLMYHILFLAWKYKIQRNSVKAANSLLCHVWVLQGWAQGMTHSLWSQTGCSVPGWHIPCTPVPQEDHELSLRIIFVCFNIFCVFSWLRHWEVVETSLFDHFLQLW